MQRDEGYDSPHVSLVAIEQFEAFFLSFEAFRSLGFAPACRRATHVVAELDNVEKGGSRRRRNRASCRWWQP